MEPAAATVLSPTDLTALDIFNGLEESALDWLLANATVVEIQARERYLVHRDDEAVDMFVLLSGVVQFVFYPNGAPIRGFIQRRGDTFGVLPFSRMTHYTGDGEVLEDMRAIRLHKRLFKQLLDVSPELGRRLVGLMSDRVRESTKVIQQREKMMALGKLSAGLAHELNNPASAIQRAVDSLDKRMGMLPTLVSALAARAVTKQQFCAADDALSVSLDGAPAQALSALDLADREDELLDWLEDREVEEAWKMAEPLAEQGFTTDTLDAMTAQLPADAVPAILQWIEFRQAADGLIGELKDAAHRISELIGSVKTYSHMDQSPDRQYADLHTGIDSTLRMLGHKLRKKNIAVERHFEAALPEVPIYVSELNQVWTNIIDNAIDAMDEDGTLTIRTEVEGPMAVIHLQDTGAGVPQDIQDRIFEAFFSTKGVGQGTGLGLDITRRIVTHHSGTIGVASVPGRTVFTVRLPLTADAQLSATM
ncbi:MAG: ATP-binding protein [Bacteroidota bacterium]